MKISFKKVNKIKFVIKGASVLQCMIKKILNISESNQNDINFLILHQASTFLINKISEKINFYKKKIILIINIFGNTNFASISETIFNSQKNINNSKILISGFVVWLSWGTALLNLNNKNLQN